MYLLPRPVYKLQQAHFTAHTINQDTYVCTQHTHTHTHTQSLTIIIDYFHGDGTRQVWPTEQHVTLESRGSHKLQCQHSGACCNTTRIVIKDVEHNIKYSTISTWRELNYSGHIDSAGVYGDNGTKSLSLTTIPRSLGTGGGSY